MPRRKAQPAAIEPAQHEAVAELQGVAGELVARAQALVVTEETLAEASDLLVQLATARATADQLRQFFVRPLNEQVRRINDFFRRLVEPLERVDRELREKVLAFRQEQERRRREEEARLLQAGADVLPVPVLTTTPVRSVATEFGRTSFRTEWTFEIVDESQLPREFLMPNTKAIAAAVRAGVRHIPGVRIYQREVVVVSAH